MKITVIGCWGAYPPQAQACSGYLLQTSEKNLLIDCGSGVLSVLQKYIGLDEIDGVLLSHYHSDHMADIYCFQYAAMISMQLGKRSKPLEIYAHDLDPQFSKLNFLPYSTAHPISPEKSLRIGNAFIKFLWTEHPVPCLSLKVVENGKSFVYTGDTGWSDQIVPWVQDADLILSECSLHNAQYNRIKGHLTAGEAGKLAALASAKRLILTHLPHYGERNVLIQQAGEHFKGQLELAKEGLSLVL